MNMRILFFIALTLVTGITSLSQEAHAQKITKEMGERYYQDCINKQPQQALTEKNHKLLCACTASKMIDNMRTEDIKKMTSRDPATAREGLNFMLINVYAPCMEYPADDHYYNTCISNPQTKTLAGDAKQLCSCMSRKVADYLGKYGKEVFQDILKRNPHINDPMSALEGDKEFQDYVGKQVLGCVI